MTEGGSPDEDPAVLSLDHAVIFAGELGASKSHASSPVGHSAHQPTRRRAHGPRLDAAQRVRAARSEPAFPRRLPRPGRRPARSAGRSAARPATEDFSDLDEEADSIRHFQ